MNERWKRSIVRTGSALTLCILCAACVHESTYAPRVHAGDAQQGETKLARFECGACHIIPGIPGAVGRVGPTLAAYSSRTYVAGKFPNEPETLVRFIRDPPAMAPLTGMPSIGLTDQDARDIAAYLYELD